MHAYAVLHVHAFQDFAPVGKPLMHAKVLSEACIHSHIRTKILGWQPKLYSETFNKRL